MSGYVQALLINYPSITAVKTENMQGFYTPKDFTKFPSHTSSPNLMSGQGWDGIGMGLELTFLPPVSLKTQSLPAPTMSPYSDKPLQTCHPYPSTKATVAISPSCLRRYKVEGLQVFFIFLWCLLLKRCW
jgi:hypothetical protein